MSGLRRCFAGMAAVLAVLHAGCIFGPLVGWNGAPAPPPGLGVYPNPNLIPMAEYDLLWEQVVDVVDDHFRIAREDRVRLVGDVLTEGRLDTFPELGATLLEPHRSDSVGLANRVESTLQTMRRRAEVRVIPTEGGFLVEFVVHKELEALRQPAHAATASATFRNSPREMADDEVEIPGPRRPRTGWIPRGRDAALEQLMHAALQERLALLGRGH